VPCLVRQLPQSCLLSKMAVVRALLWTCVLFSTSPATQLSGSPMMKVIMMLQTIQRDTSEEFGRQGKIHEKAMCECKTTLESLAASIAAAERNIPTMKGDVGSLTSNNKILEEELKEEEKAFAEARNGELTAVSLREKEQAANQAKKDELDSAMLAVERAMMVLKARSFLQDATALPKLRELLNTGVIRETHRRKVLSLLEHADALQGNDMIIGVLENLAEDLHKDYQKVKEAEKAAADDFRAMMKSKRSEGGETKKVIQEKKERLAENTMQLVDLKRELLLTENKRKEDTVFFAELKKSCKEKKKLWDERSRTQTEELAALAEVIEMLDSDASNSLLSKALGGSNGLSLLQLAPDGRDEALDEISDALDELPSTRRQGLQLISMELQSKAVDLSQVIKMIDKLLKSSDKEEEVEEAKKKYCEETQAGLRAKKQALESKSMTLEFEMKNLKESLEMVKQDIQEMKDGIAALDESVQEATDQRKAEYTGLQEFKKETGDARDLLQRAEQRLGRAYKPKSQGGFLLQEVSGALEASASQENVAVLLQLDEEDNVAVQDDSSASDSGSKVIGVMRILQNLAKDLDKSLAKADEDEKESQAEYELFMKESGKKRSLDSKALTAKATIKASKESDLQQKEDLKASAREELLGHGKLEDALTKECGFLLKYWEARVDGRMRERYALQRVRRKLAGVSGATSFAQIRAEAHLVPQVHAHRNLRGPSS